MRTLELKPMAIRYPWFADAANWIHLRSIGEVAGRLGERFIFELEAEQAPLDVYRVWV